MKNDILPSEISLVVVAVILSICKHLEEDDDNTNIENHDPVSDDAHNYQQRGFLLEGLNIPSRNQVGNGRH